MGEMADFALEEVYTMESLREVYARGEMCSQTAFDLGLIDSMGCYDEVMQAAFDRVGSEPFDQEELIRESQYLGTLLDVMNTHTEDIPTYRVNLDKYARKWSMIKGMKDQVLKGRELSDKQKKWLSTNIKFDVEDFGSVCRNNPKVCDKIDALYRVTNRRDNAKNKYV